MPKPDHNKLFALASQQAGYFTANQAHQARFSGALLWHHVRGGRFRRIRHGLYRFTQYPPSTHDHVIEAWLAVGADAVVSHESALSLHGLSNVIPDAVHLTVSRERRRRAGRRPPKGVRLHTTTKSLRTEDIVIRHGVRVTSAARSIADAAEAGTDPEQILLAINQLLRQGLATRRQLLVQVADRPRRVAGLIKQGIEAVSGA